MQIEINADGRIFFQEDAAAAISLPIFDVVELDFDEELDDLDYYLAEFDIEEAI